LSNLDHAIVLGYIALLVVLGSAARPKTTSLDQYALAGRRVPWWIAAIAIFVADLSAISLLGAPAWAFEKDLCLAFGLVALPFGAVAVALLLIPRVVRKGTVSVYEYLERRFGVPVRRYGAAIFLLLRGGWAATALYATSLALAEVTPLSQPAAAVVLATATAGYVFLGGARGVVWVALMQFTVVVAGLACVGAALMQVSAGDLGALWYTAATRGHTVFLNFSLSPLEEVTVWGVTAYTLGYCVTAYGADQAMAQRYLATPSKGAMVRAILGTALLSLPLGAAMYLLGTLLAGYYGLHPALARSLPEPGRVLPHFVSHALPAGLRGMVLAGIFGATLSSVSAGFNSLATSTIVDFTSPSMSETRKVALIRLATAAWGAAACLTALFLGRLGAILEIAGKIGGYFGGVLGGLFLLGLMCRRAQGWQVVVGSLVGAGGTLGAARLGVSWLWYGAVGAGTTLAIGWLLALLWPSTEKGLSA